MTKWKVARNPISSDEFIYGVYRIIDEEKTDHSGNREVEGYYKNREIAVEVANKLNEEYKGGE